MANQEQLEILRQGVKIWNKWREENPSVKIDLLKADLKGVTLQKVNFNRANLVEANFVDANLHEADLSESDLRGANLAFAYLRKTDFDLANLEKAYLGNSDLLGASFWRANLSKAILRFAELTGTYFKEAILGSADLLECTLYNSDLNRADLNLANLSDCRLRFANLEQANLRGADLEYADLRGAKLIESDFRGASLKSASLNEADLTRVKLANTKLFHTSFGFTDLSKATELEDVVHEGPSILNYETIVKSKGRIPDVFLRGCGLRDLEIEFAKLTTYGLDPEQVTDITDKINQLYLGEGIQYYSCFISYSSKDQAFAQQLHDDLQNNGVRCWFAPEDMKIGDKIRPTIDRQIRLRDKLLVILSENSVQSEWVGDEVEAALEEESASGRLVLFPIRLDDAVMDTRDDWAAKIKRRRHIGDFSNWKDEGSYQKAFERLLRDLKANGGE